MHNLDDAVIEEMVERAKKISEKAYCPYSNFKVGASVLSDDLQIYDGCNIENSSYGLSICAERNAVFHMMTKCASRIKAVIVYTPTQMPSTPCGACRQVISEFTSQAIVICTCNSDKKIISNISELLPYAFGKNNLSERG